jgi:hypothetical protein
MEDKVMKTMNSKSEETGMKAIITVAIIFAMIITLNAYGATFKKEMKATTAMSTFAGYLAEESDSEAELEEWMLDKNNFLNAYPLEASAETPLNMENWMTDANLFPAIADLEKETEELLRIEDWMFNDSLFSQPSEENAEPEVLAQAEQVKIKRVIGVTFEKAQFGRRAFIIIEEEDPKLNMEIWMVDYRHWRKK